MRAELEFDTPDPRVRVVFSHLESLGFNQTATMTITGLSFAFAKELQRRWNAAEENHERVAS